jgi:hypothetical protein
MAYPEAKAADGDLVTTGRTVYTFSSTGPVEAAVGT